MTNDLDREIDTYLTTLHSSQWGKSFNLVDQKSREECIAYIKTVISNIMYIGYDAK